MNNRKTIFVMLTALIIISAVILLDYFNLIPKKTYTADDFGFSEQFSSVDFNNNGIDDYTDILLGARIDAKNHPKYDGGYFSGGYPPENIGVCTDVVWRAFKNAGYSLRDMVDKDIANRPEAYTEISKPDRNIDFRRVRNLRIFFDKYAQSLTCDIQQIEEWQRGDIVIFGADKHIGIVSNKRNKSGRPYILHNGGQPNREEDYLGRDTVSGHYRFDASNVPEEILVPLS